MKPKIHTLKNGATVVSVSAHPFKFSDGTESEPQEKEIVDALTVERDTPIEVLKIKGMPVNKQVWKWTQEQSLLLSTLCHQADIVIIPFPLLAALKENGNRDCFPNAVAFNATKETQRSAPSEKIVDIENWSY